MALFPELKDRTVFGSDSIDQPDNTIYTVFVLLLPMSHKAHRAHNDEMLRRIYGYAEWCMHQPHHNLYNAAGVAFWEHVFDERDLWDAVVPWVSPHMIHMVTPLWDWRLGAEVWAQVKMLIETRKVHRYREYVYWTGEIDEL